MRDESDLGVDSDDQRESKKSDRHKRMVLEKDRRRKKSDNGDDTQTIKRGIQKGAMLETHKEGE